MFEWNEEYQKMACRILISKKMVPPEDHLGIAYDCFVTDMNSYDPEKSTNPVLYYGHRLVARIQQERGYGGIIHIPVAKQGTEVLSVSSLDTPLSTSDGTATLGDMIEGTVEPENDLEYDDLVTKLTENLDDDEKNLFNMFIVGDGNQTEYAKALGTSKQMVHRSVQLLRDKLKVRIGVLSKIG